MKKEEFVFEAPEEKEANAYLNDNYFVEGEGKNGSRAIKVVSEAKAKADALKKAEKTPKREESLPDL